MSKDFASSHAESSEIPAHGNDERTVGSLSCQKDYDLEVADIANEFTSVRQAGCQPMRKLKIAVVANTGWYLYNFRRNLMLSLKAMGHEAIAIAPTDNYAKSLRNDDIEFFDVQFHGAGVNPFSEFGTVIKLRKVFVKESVDVVLSYTPKGNIYSALALSGLDRRLIVNVSGLGRVFTQDGFFAQLVKILYRISFRKAEFVFFQNNDDRSVFIKKKIVDPVKTGRLPGSGVDLEHFACVSNNDIRISNHSEKTKFLFVARLLWDKGIGEYVAAARAVKSRFPFVKFQVLGSMDSVHASAVPREKLEEWIREGVIQYLGTTDDVRLYLKEADCVVLPSFYREGVPRSLLEAAAMGKPVITTDAIGCRDAVEDKVTGFLCNPRDSHDLAEKMILLISQSQDELFNMGRRAREKMEKEFDENIVLNAYSEIIGKQNPTVGSSELFDRNSIIHAKAD
jgi:glycosyltransferase involved in cell wall biosynthesis